jgi:probable phosphoglycerate mutase
LTEHGQEQAKALAPWAARERIARVYTSPRERCVQTAQYLCGSAALRIEVSSALDEFDFGEWTGREIASLDGDEHWRRFNAERSQARAPRGESMLEVQQRIVAALKYWAALYAPFNIIAVTHAEPIRAALLYFLGRPLDAWGELEIGEASVNTIEFDGEQHHVIENNAPGNDFSESKRDIIPSTTVGQSPARLCRNSFIVGYHGDDSRPSIQRQSARSGSNVQTGFPNVPAR